MTLSPDHHTNQNQRADRQRGCDLDHGTFLSVVSNPAPVLPCRQGPAMPTLAAGAANGPAAFSSLHGSCSRCSAPAEIRIISRPLCDSCWDEFSRDLIREIETDSIIECGPAGFDFDPFQFFDFFGTPVRARPRLRLVADNTHVIKNSRSVRA